MLEPSNLQVVLMGIITVFVALVILIVMIKLMSSIINKFTKNSIQEPEFAEAGVLEFTEEMLKVAVAVAIAEDMDEDVSRLRISSIKQL